MYIKKLIFKILITTTITFIVLSFFTTSGMLSYEEPEFETGIVTASLLNVRQGPSIFYPVITQINKNEYVRLFAKIGDWYVIQTEGDLIGTASADYIKPIDHNNTMEIETSVSDSSLTRDESEAFELINNFRVQNGLSPLVINEELQNVARIKAQEMVDGEYFSHTSPTYGSPFDMMQTFNIQYKTAGENIAGNSTNSAAVEAWITSENHKANILNNSYNYTGIAVVNSPIYGKIYVQMFIGAV